MTHVFVVQHLRTMPDDSEDVKLIGVYSTRRRAELAVRRLSKQPGFKRFPRLIEPENDDATEGFSIDRHHVDQDQWTEGFVTVRSASRKRSSSRPKPR